MTSLPPAHDAPALYMAPMLGITDSAYRAAFMEHFGGFDHAVTPFLKTLQGGRYHANKLADVLPARNKALPIHPQILSNNAEDFIALAQALHDLGYARINVNFGCPVPMAAGRGRGAGLLPHPEFVDRFLDRILGAIPNQLSVKTRVGFDRDDQLLAMTEVFNRYPLFEVAIHPRTAKQGYGGSVLHDAFAAASARLKASVVYSGDINTLADFVAIRERHPHVRKWMLGRGALADPHLPQAIQAHLRGDPTPTGGRKALAVADLPDFYRRFARHCAQRGSAANVTLMRVKTLFYYHAGPLGCGKATIKRVRKARDLEEALAALEAGE